MLLGAYGLIFELMNPGTVLPGTVGAISLLTALFAFNMLPVDYAGAGLVLLGIALLVAEAFIGTFGALGAGGIIAFLFGSIMMFHGNAPGFGLSLSVVLAATVVARQAEAERSRRAKVISALGEEQAAEKLLEAAKILQPIPQAMQLRYLTALFDISNERTSTIVFPFPIEILRAWGNEMGTKDGEPHRLRCPDRNPTLHQETGSCSSAQKPVSNSRPLYAGRRPLSHQAPRGLISGEESAPDFDDI